MQGLVMDDGLVGGLSIGLRMELHENRGYSGSFTCAVFGLFRFHKRKQTLEFGTAPIDGIDLLTDEKLEADSISRCKPSITNVPMSRTILGRDPTTSSRTGFSIDIDGVNSTFFHMLALFDSLGSILESCLD